MKIGPGRVGSGRPSFFLDLPHGGDLRLLGMGGSVGSCTSAFVFAAPRRQPAAVRTEW
jgi:hypothetical protein